MTSNISNKQRFTPIISKHTPAPWSVDFGDDQRSSEIWAGDSIIADVHSHATGTGCHADATLIAAAPDLLNACKLALAAHENGANIDWRTLNRAITKATGEPSKPTTEQPKCSICGGSRQIKQRTSANAPYIVVKCPFCAGDGKCRTPDTCGPHGCHGGCLPVETQVHEQHDRDSAELRRLCQARDDARKERDLARVEIAGLKSSVGHLSSMMDSQTRLVQKAEAIMKALHESATPIIGPDMDAQIPGNAFHKFVDGHAEILHATANGPRLTTSSVTPQQATDEVHKDAERAKQIATTAAEELIRSEGEATGPDEYAIPQCQADEHMRECIAHLIWVGEASSQETEDGYIIVRFQDLTLESLA